MICPKCGEDNSSSFRFCGLCGTLLQNRVEAPVPQRRPAGSPLTGMPVTGLPRMYDSTVTQGAVAEEPANQPLGRAPNPVPSETFSGLTSFAEPEKQTSGIGRILFLIGLLAALGYAGHWAYISYLGAMDAGKPQTSATSGDGSQPQGEAEDADPQTRPSTRSMTAPTTSAPPSATPNPPGSRQPEAAESRSNQRLTASSPPNEDAGAPPLKAENRPAARTAPPIQSKPVRPAKIAATHTPIAVPAKAPRLVATAPDTGDAEFRKAEAYLYGHGAAENCDQVVRLLKESSAKSNAKARGAFGTMYATGHCVPRDLPTSYQWFAMALQVDPNNQILSKDLTSIWNEMTPPERQMAERMKK